MELSGETHSSDSSAVAPAALVSETDPNRILPQQSAPVLKRKPTLKVTNAVASSKPILKSESSTSLQQQISAPPLSTGISDAAGASTSGSQANHISASLDSRSRSTSVSPKPTILHSTTMIDSDLNNSSPVERSRALHPSVVIAFPDSSHSQRPLVADRKDIPAEKLLSAFTASSSSISNPNNTNSASILSKNLDDSHQKYINSSQDKPIAKQPSCLSFNEPSDLERSRRGSISTNPSNSSLSNIGTSSTHPQLQLALQRYPSTLSSGNSLLNPSNSVTNVTRSCSILKKDPSTIVMLHLDNSNIIVRDTSYKNNKTSSQKPGKLDLNVNADILNFTSRKRMDNSTDGSSSLPQQKVLLQSQKRQALLLKISSASPVSDDSKKSPISKEIDFSVDPRQLERVRVESKLNNTILVGNNNDMNDENTKPLIGTGDTVSLLSSAVNSRSNSLSSRSNSNNSIANKDITKRCGSEEVTFNVSKVEKKSDIVTNKKDTTFGLTNNNSFTEKAVSYACSTVGDVSKEKKILTKSVSISSTNLRETAHDEKKTPLLEDTEVPRLNDSDISLLRRNFSQLMRHPAITAHQQATMAAKALSEPSLNAPSGTSVTGPRIPFTKYFQKTDDHKIHILLGVSGSVATIKIAEVIDKLYKVFGRDKVSIQLVITKFSECFLKGLKIPQDVKIWRDEDQWFGYHSNDPILHAELRKWADIFIVAPISANTLSKIANGIADNLLTSIFRVWNPTYPIIIAPAMNTFMYTHPVTKIQLQFLIENLPWIKILRPVEKILACGDIGMGGMTTAYEISMTAKKELLSLKNKKLMELKKYQKEQERLRNNISAAPQEDDDNNDEDNDENDDDDDDDDDDDEDDEDDEEDDDDEDDDEDNVEDDNFRNEISLNGHKDENRPIAKKSAELSISQQG